MQVRLGDGDDALLFATKHHCRVFFSRMLHGYEPPAVVSAEDARHLVELLKHHPNGAERIWTGIDHFEVRYRRYGKPCFYVVQFSGDAIDFSYKKAVRGYKPN